MTKKVDDLVAYWRSVGPVAWAEGPHGWIGLDRQPITLEPWQRAVLLAWWQNKDRVSTLAISNVKKTGKTFDNAVLLAWRWLALPGDHFAIGNDFDQSASRQFQEISEMVRRNAFLVANCKATSRQIVFIPTGSVITALSVDAAGNAGANHWTASHTEAWGIIYEAGVRAFEELTPPPGRLYGFPALRICDSYAGWVGESKVWHETVDRGLHGKRIGEEWPIFLKNGLLLFHMDGLEAQQRCFRGTPEEAAVYYDDQRSTLRPGTFDRLHMNKRATGEDAFIQLEAWDKCVDQESRPIMPNSEQPLFVGVDGSIKHDSAAVVAVYYDRKSGKVVLAKHGIWQPTAHDPLDIDKTIGDYLRRLKTGYRLREVHYDPYQLHDLSTRLKSDGIPMVEYPQSVPNLTVMGQNLYDLIQDRNLVLYPDGFMRTCASHAIAVQSSRGWRIAKEKSSYKIDVIVALAMASLAATEHGPSRGWALRMAI
jgi:phage terminase large subunit-like protein